MSAFYGPNPTDEENIKVLNRAIELGCTFWDTAVRNLNFSNVILNHKKKNVS
jgi:hypothetical protein